MARGAQPGCSPNAVPSAARCAQAEYRSDPGRDCTAGAVRSTRAPAPTRHPPRGQPGRPWRCQPGTRARRSCLSRPRRAGPEPGYGPHAQMPRGGSECRIRLAARAARPEPAIGHACLTARTPRPGLHVAYACGRRGQRFISLTRAFAPSKIGDVQLTGCSAGALTEPGAQRARKFAHRASQVQFHAGRGSAGHSNRYLTRAVFSGRPQVRKKAASPAPNSSSGGEAQSSSAFVPSTAALPEPLCTESGAQLHRVWRVPFRASLPPGGCRPGVGGFAVADAPHGQGSPRRRRRSVGSLNVTAERATAAPDPPVRAFALPALPLSGREGRWPARCGGTALPTGGPC